MRGMTRSEGGCEARAQANEHAVATASAQSRRAPVEPVVLVIRGLLTAKVQLCEFSPRPPPRSLALLIRLPRRAACHFAELAVPCPRHSPHSRTGRSPPSPR